MTTQAVDTKFIRNHLNELKSQFDKGILEGGVFETLKKIYMEIKEIDCHLKVLEWDSEKGRAHNTSYDKSHSHLKEQKPLL